MTPPELADVIAEIEKDWKDLMSESRPLAIAERSALAEELERLRHGQRNQRNQRSEEQIRSGDSTSDSTPA